ncbi:MAG: amidohydrolase family protein [Planctomycetes bacterium]|nr:amidohydrolase family protein [Planctomycetota bacterium]
MKNRPRGVALGLSLAHLCLATVAPQSPPPDQILINGNIYTLHPERPRVEALALAGDRIVAIGANAEIRALAQGTVRTINLDGRTVLPGLIDAHGHMAGLGFFGLGRLDLSDAGASTTCCWPSPSRSRTQSPASGSSAAAGIMSPGRIASCPHTIGSARSPRTIPCG